MQIWSLLAIAMFLGPQSGHPVSDHVIKVLTLDGTEILHYDPAKVTRHNLVRWAQFSENVASDNHYLVPEWLEVCLDRSKDYAPCGSRDPKAPNFRHNAEVNLEKIRKRIAVLKSSNFPKALLPVVSYFRTIQTTSLSIYTHELRFLETAEPSELEVPIGDVDPSQVCSDVLSRVRSTHDRNAAYELVKMGWHNCVNLAFRNRLGGYPRSAWDNFLKRNSIREEFIDDSDVD